MDDLFTPEDKQQITDDLEEINELEKEEDLLDYFSSYAESPKIIEESKKHRGRPTGFETLDFLIGGVSSGELIVVTAPTGVGKTTLCQSISWKLAKTGMPSLWYTLEVSPENFIQPFITNDPEAKWDAGGKLLKVSSLPIYWPRKMENITFQKLKQAIRYAHLNFGVEHVFIDHLHYLISGKEMMQAKSSSLFIGDRLRQLRQIAHETGVSIFLVAHIAKTSDDKQPTINDLRDSSFVAQEADVVVILHRERLPKPIIREDKGFQVETLHSSIVVGAVEKARRTGNRGVFYLQHSKGLYDEIKREEAKNIIAQEKNGEGGDGEHRERSDLAN